MKRGHTLAAIVLLLSQPALHKSAQETAFRAACVSATLEIWPNDAGASGGYLDVRN